MCVSNFAGLATHGGYRVGLPFGGGWVEILNTDAEEFGGSNVVNVGTIIAEDTPWNVARSPRRCACRWVPWLVPASQAFVRVPTPSRKTQVVADDWVLQGASPCLTHPSW